MGNIIYCFQCECYHHHSEYIDRLMGGVRMKFGKSYCTQKKKYKKLGVRESTKGIPSWCPKKISPLIFTIHRMDEDPCFGFRPSYRHCHEVYSGTTTSACVEDLRCYLATDPNEKKLDVIKLNDVVTIFNGLATATWLYNGKEFEPIKYFDHYILNRSV